MYVDSDFIYQAKAGKIYDRFRKQFNCYRPTMSGNFGFVDCKILDEHGNLHPELIDQAVSINTADLGIIVNRINHPIMYKPQTICLPA